MKQIKKERILWTIGMVLIYLIVSYSFRHCNITGGTKISERPFQEQLGKNMRVNLEKRIETSGNRKLIDSLNASYSITLPLYYYFKQNKHNSGIELINRRDLFGDNIINYLKNENNLTDYDSDNFKNVMDFVLNSKTEEELNIYYRTGLRIIENADLYCLFPDDTEKWKLTMDKKLVDLIQNDYSLMLPIYYYLKEEGNILKQENNEAAVKKLIELIDSNNEFFANELLLYLKKENNLNKGNDSESLVDIVKMALKKKSKNELQDYYNIGDSKIEKAYLYFYLFPEALQSDRFKQK